jgi:mannose-6-phosphate isomerase-like protein (cupin superfamily)
MARQGHTIENPASGERIKWHLTSADTDGELVRAEVWVRPSGAVPGAHIHRRSEERFELIAGTMGIQRGGDRVELTRGQRATVPAGVEHRWWNAADDELHFMVELQPALHFEQLMETVAGLARDGRTRPNGFPGLLQLAVIARDYGDEVQSTVPPLWLQRPLFAVLAPIGRALGRRSVYEAYSGGAAATEPVR